MAIVEIRPDAWYSVLQVDGMHFSAAQRSLNRAKRAFPAVRSARDVAAETQAEITELLDREKENERSYYEDIEPLAIKAEGQDTDLAAAYAPYLEAIASVHILAAASAEAHINDRSKSRLAGRYWREFEQLSLEAKWLLFPRIVGLGELDAGAEPLQGLARLVRRRNVLVHYKPKRDYWEPPGVPLVGPAKLVPASELALGKGYGRQDEACTFFRRADHRNLESRRSGWERPCGLPRA